MGNEFDPQPGTFAHNGLHFCVELAYSEVLFEM